MENTNMFAREEEYQLLRRFLKMMVSADRGGLAESVRCSIEEDLTPRQRQLVAMYYLEQMRMQDIADELNIHISTVSRTLKRARNNMKNHLQYSGRAVLEAFGD